jgi:hypothetical protein
LDDSVEAGGGVVAKFQAG